MRFGRVPKRVKAENLARTIQSLNNAVITALFDEKVAIEGCLVAFRKMSFVIAQEIVTNTGSRRGLCPIAYIFHYFCLILD